jgi:hypothetical protein
MPTPVPPEVLAAARAAMELIDRAGSPGNFRTV